MSLDSLFIKLIARGVGTQVKATEAVEKIKAGAFEEFKPGLQSKPNENEKNENIAAPAPTVSLGESNSGTH